MEERNRSPDDRMEALKEQHYFEIIHMFAKFSSPKLGSGGSFNCVSRGASTRKNKEKPKNLVRKKCDDFLFHFLKDLWW